MKTTLNNGKQDEVGAILQRLRPYDQAEVLRRLEPVYQLRVFKVIPTALAADIFQELEREEQLQLLVAIGADKAATILNEMSADDAADLLAELDHSQQRELLSLLQHEEADELRSLLAYPEQSAGGIMTTEFVSLAANNTVQEVFEQLRRVSRKAETIYYLYVVDEHERLVGVLSIRDLIMAEPDTRVVTIMIRDLVAAKVNDDQEDVARMIEQYDLLAIPVVDQARTLVGIVTVDDIIDVITDEATEDIARLNAISGPVSAVDDLRVGAFAAARKRLPWLVLLLFIGIISGNIISSFEETLEAVVILAVFIPMIADMAGNTGTQSLALVVRGLALGEFKTDDIMRLLRREFGVGLILGTVNGVAIAVIATVWQRSAALGFVIGFSLWLTLIVATLVGAIVPIILNRFRVDPAVASGPFITTINDIVGLTIYFSIATALIVYLI
ncbi:MAG: magnesium transporter [Clostridia bacterium]|nr:magnesium transporter [Clostridia bacterium]